MSDSGLGSLRWCIKNARLGDTITFAQNVRGTITLTGGNLIFLSGKHLTIRGPGASRLIIRSGDPNTEIAVSKGAILSISDLSFRGRGDANQSLLYNNGILTLTSSTVSGNSTNSGGGILNDSSGTMTLIHSVVSGNSASGVSNDYPNTYGGGGIYNKGTMILTSSMVSHNSANDIGGGIYNDKSAVLTLNNSTVFDNTDNSSGAGGINNDGTLKLINSTIFHNFDTGIDNNGISTVINSTISGNSATDSGGGISNVSSLTLIGTTVSGNSATGNGGGIFNDATITDQGATATLIDSTIFGNSSSGDGGGIAQRYGAAAQPSHLIILFCTIYNNSTRTSSGAGGGLWSDPKRVIQNYPVLVDSIIAANHAQHAPDISGPLITKGYNLVGNFAGASFTDPQNLHFTDRQVPQLDNLFIASTLRKNGGPTLTLAIFPDSPAIDAVPLDACDLSLAPTDQRGVKRPQGSGCDIGAYEYQPGEYQPGRS
jgi:hypothetical protein